MAKTYSPFNHVATLNLFREPDGTHEITIAAGDADIMLETEEGLKPFDHFENLILSAADRMKVRKQADGTYREIVLWLTK